MKRLAIALAAGAAVSSLAFASASVLNVDGGTIQAGQDTTSCDTDGVKANWGLETDDNSVRSVRITGIDAACAGAEMWVSVDGKKLPKAIVPAGGGQVTLSFTAPYPTPESINDVKIWIEG